MNAKNIDNAMNADNADNADNAGNAGSAENAVNESRRTFQVRNALQPARRAARSCGYFVPGVPTL
jgi:hypothetical protein